MRPAFADALNPLDPTVLVNAAMFSSCRSTSTTRAWASSSPWNEMSSGPSVVHVICPLSSLGRNPFGSTYR